MSSVKRFKPIIPRSVVVLAANRDLRTLETFAFNCGAMASPAAKKVEHPEMLVLLISFSLRH